MSHPVHARVVRFGLPPPPTNSFSTMWWLMICLYLAYPKWTCRTRNHFLHAAAFPSWFATILRSGQVSHYPSLKRCSSSGLTRDLPSLMRNGMVTAPMRVVFRPMLPDSADSFLRLRENSSADRCPVSSVVALAFPRVRVTRTIRLLTQVESVFFSLSTLKGWKKENK